MGGNIQNTSMERYRTCYNCVILNLFLYLFSSNVSSTILISVPYIFVTLATGELVDSFETLHIREKKYTRIMLSLWLFLSSFPPSHPVRPHTQSCNTLPPA